MMPFKPHAGMTLVELVVAMAILSVIVSIGAQSFLVVLKTEREMEGQRGVWGGVQLISDELRRTADNLIPAQVGGIKPYEENLDPERGVATYRFLTRLSEGYRREEMPGSAQAMLVEFYLEPDGVGGTRLGYARQPIGPGGRLGDSFKGILAEHVAQFTVTPELAEQSGEAAEGDSVQVPKALNVVLQPSEAEFATALNMRFLVRVQAAKKNDAANVGGGDRAAKPGTGEGRDVEASEEK